MAELVFAGAVELDAEMLKTSAGVECHADSPIVRLYGAHIDGSSSSIPLIQGLRKVHAVDITDDDLTNTVRNAESRGAEVIRGLEEVKQRCSAIEDEGERAE